MKLEYFPYLVNKKFGPLAGNVLDGPANSVFLNVRGVRLLRESKLVFNGRLLS